MANNLINLKENDNIRGFRIDRIRESKEGGGNLVEMTHSATGAKLCWMNNGEENKLFSVGFKTLPEDSTGVFHILEHSVLCGSEKFPVKEPFVELLKSSMNTFLNAMTYPDKTLYPVSSRNHQDYMNLMEVYLDAVFKPAILKNPNIFYQEGFHIDTTAEKPVFKGVVYNEMKGAMSDVDSILERTLQQMLFPDNCYGYNSGGDPISITDLTYEEFINTYKRYYHPSNSYFFLDGDIDIDKSLAMIESYLNDFREENSRSCTSAETYPNISHENLDIKRQTHVVSDLSMPYEVTSDDDKAVVALGRIVGNYDDRGKILALNILCEYLADSNESPLTRAVLSSGLAEDLDIYTMDGIYQPYIMIVLRGAKENSEKDIKNLIRNTVSQILADGIEKDDITALTNQLAFRIRQLPEPQAIYRASNALSSWLYGGDPLLYINTDEATEELRNLINDGIIEKLASEIFIDTDNLSCLTLMPSTTYGKQKLDEEEAKLAKMLAQMSDDEFNKLKRLNENLVQWQTKEDSSENLAKIPRLSLDSINPDIKPFEISVSKYDEQVILNHKLNTNGILYITMYYKLTHLTIDELTKASILTELFSDLPTENYSVNELQREIKTYIGNLSFDIDILPNHDDKRTCIPCLKVKVAVLKENISHVSRLVNEILWHTKFDDDNLIMEIISQLDEDMKRQSVASGHKLAALVARSSYSAQDVAMEAISGYTFIEKIRNVRKSGENALDELREFISKRLLKHIGKSNIIFSITSDEDQKETDDIISTFISSLPTGISVPENAAYKAKEKTDSRIAITSAVSHAVKAWDISSTGLKYDGSLSVASNIISLSYLWNEIRVKGGAYGGSMSASRTGKLICFSYRDPSPSKSLETYNHIAEFLNAYCDNVGNSLDGFIISTLSQTDPLLSPEARGKFADDMYFAGLDHSKLIQMRSEILSTDAEKLRKWIEVLNNMSKDASTCVVGSEPEVLKCPGNDILYI